MNENVGSGQEIRNVFAVTVEAHAIEDAEATRLGGRRAALAAGRGHADNKQKRIRLGDHRRHDTVEPLDMRLGADPEPNRTVCRDMQARAQRAAPVGIAQFLPAAGRIDHRRNDREPFGVELPILLIGLGRRTGQGNDVGPRVRPEDSPSSVSRAQ